MGSHSRACPLCGSPISAKQYNGFAGKEFPESVRDDLHILLAEVGIGDYHFQKISPVIASYPEAALRSALQVWKRFGYGKQGKGVYYFIAIAKERAERLRKETKFLDALPPLEE